MLSSIDIFENRVLRRIFGPKRDEVMGEWRKLHNEELHDLYSSPSIPHILKSNPHPFYSFRGLKNQMRIRIERGLDLRSRAGVW
jgi:hypothetical protein